MNNLVCGKFLNILSNTIIGVCVGLVVALILTLVLHFTCFRERNMALLYVAMFLVLALCGGFVQYRFFKYVESDGMPTPQEQVQTTIDTIQNKWQNTNGFFSPEQISKAQKDDSAPTADDQILQFECCDLGPYVAFGYNSGETYQNILFYKSPNGLIVDGMINMSATIGHKYKFLAYWYYNLSSFAWCDIRPYDEFLKTANAWDVVKYISLSSQDASSFCNKYSDVFVHEWDKANAYAMQQAAILTGNNAATNFIKFGNVELIGSANTGYTKINSFYNYLYQQIQGTQYGSTKLIDANSALCLPIPQSEQEKYPIPESKKSEYGDKEFYGVYKCNIAVELKRLQSSITAKTTTKNEEFFEDLHNDDRYKDKVKVEKVESTATYSKLNLTFKDTGNSDLTNLNLLTSPVTITFTNTETNTTKKVVVDSLDKLQNGVSVLLDKGVNVKYEVRGNGLVFENHDGTFKLTDDSNALTLNYYYVANNVVASFGLNPIGTIDMSQIDLSSNPVKIIIKNSKNSYAFTFDDNSKINNKQSQLVELGEYEYAILSDSLVFASNSGKLNITTTDHEFLFNYAHSTSYCLVPSLLSSENVGNEVGCLSLCFSDAAIDYFFPFTSRGEIQVNVYDSDNKFLLSKRLKLLDKHLMYGKSLSQLVFDGLSSGNLTLQFKFKRSSDGQVVLVSQQITFDYVFGYDYSFMIDLSIF